MPVTETLMNDLIDSINYLPSSIEWIKDGRIIAIQHQIELPYRARAFFH